MKKLVLLSFLLLVFSPNAFADSINERLSKVEEQLSIFEKEIYDKELSPSSKTVKQAKAKTRAMFEVRISTLEEQLRVLTGKVETAEFSNHRLHEKLDRINEELAQKLVEIKDLSSLLREEIERKSIGVEKVEEEIDILNKKIGELGKAEKEVKVAESSPKSEKKKYKPKPKGKTKIESTKIDSGLVAILRKGKPSRPSGSSEGEYDKAFSLMKNEKYDEAANKFIKFVKNFPNHKLTGEAYYWLGEISFIKDNFEKASIYFLQGYEKQPKGNKAADNLLKLGMSLGRVGKKDEACTTFGKISAEFPLTSAAIKQRIEKESNLFECN